MTQLVEVREAAQNRWSEELEKGNILFFPRCPFDFPQDEWDFLLSQKQTGASNRKNIAYKPTADRISNFVHASDAQAAKLLQIMRGFSQRVTLFLSKLLPAYALHWRLDYASFRPFQEKGRPLRTRARNDLLHVDAFPTRPMHGDRILRFFININPEESRHWFTGGPFRELVQMFGGTGGVPFPKQSIWDYFKKVGRKMGLPFVLRSPYDVFMLRLHHFMKENRSFQQSCHKDHWEFPPGCAWAVFTDQVSHAATAGQYALEQTFIVPYRALLKPQASPLGILEQISGRKMTYGS